MDYECEWCEDCKVRSQYDSVQDMLDDVPCSVEWCPVCSEFEVSDG